MAEKLIVGQGSSEVELRAAAAQLRAAQAEYAAAIKELPSGSSYDAYVNVGNQISSKYAYVEFAGPASGIVDGRLSVTVGGDRMIVPGFGNNESEITSYLSRTPSTNVQQDDAYQASVVDRTTAQNDLAAARARTDALQKENDRLLNEIGSTADASPDLAGQPTVQATGANATGTTPGFRQGGTDTTDPANTVPVTQNGDAASTGSPSQSPGSQDPQQRAEAAQEANSGSNTTDPGSTAPSDDQGDAGGTGTTANDPGGSTGGSNTNDGTGTGSNNSAVSLGQGGSTDTGGTGSGGTPNNTKIKLRPNKLHEYVNWTYQVGWYMLDAAAYNQFTETNQDSPALRSHPLMRSGGYVKNGQGLDFDLSLMDLRLNGVIGNTSSSPSANVFSIEMQVMEPYGVSLIWKLKELADRMPNGPHNHFQMPYLLEIKWLGYNDNGTPINNIPETGPKLIPVQVINITFKVTSAGTVYNITMVPYSQQGINKIYGVIQQDTTLYGDSLNALLKDGYYSLKESLTRKSQGDVNEQKALYPDTYDFEIVSFDENRGKNDKLATDPITFPQEGGAATVIMRRGMPNDRDRQSGNDPNKQYFVAKGGSQIKDVVTMLAKNSKYFQDKIVSKPNSDKEHPMELIKVVPMVRNLGKYDTIRGVYQKEIVYKVMPYYVYAELHPNVGQAPVEKRGMVKEYNWIFTGKNSDIIDLELDYNLTYFKIFEKSSTQKGVINTGANVEAPSDEVSPSTNPTYQPIAVSSQTAGTNTNKGFKPNTIEEYFDQQLNSPDNADLVTLDVTIIGDPDWIPQDRSVRPKGLDINAINSGFTDDDFTKGIATDVDSVYVKFSFRTPRDYNDTTGLMELTQDQTLISGVYKVTTVESNFSGGRFTQTLNLIRAPQQKENDPKTAKVVSPERVATSAFPDRPTFVGNNTSGAPVNIDKSDGYLPVSQGGFYLPGIGDTLEQVPAEQQIYFEDLGTAEPGNTSIFDLGRSAPVNKAPSAAEDAAEEAFLRGTVRQGARGSGARNQDF